MLTSSFLVDHPLDEVWAWHTRPGAVVRLTPPWMGVRVDSGAQSLRDGTTVLAFPAGLRWTARHLPDAFEEGRQFADELDAPVLRWRHTHRFEPAGEGRTRVTDRVDTPVPGRLLAGTFAYRARQLAGDLDSHARHPGRPLTVAMTGSSGLIGTALSAFLTSGGHTVVPLRRGAGWDPADPAPDLLDGVDALVHLAGEPIAGRFSAAHMAAVRDSRIGPTRGLAEVAARRRLPVMVSASAIGIYGADRGDEALTEESERGEGFLADLVQEWEAATAPARDAGVRVVCARTGIVQSPAGGALRLLRLLFSTGLGGRLGDGRAWMSWMGIDDAVDAYLAALTDDRLAGPVNFVAPAPVRNSEYTATLARVLHRPAAVPVPGIGPRLLLGREGAREVAGASQRVVPARLLEVGHPFRHPELEGALRHVLGKERGVPPNS